jgi:hypothetical protein
VDLALASRRFVTAAFAMALAAGFFAAWVGLDIGGTTATLWFDDVATPLAALLACVLCVRARSRQPAEMRLFWTLLALATASWTAAEVIWGYYALILNVAVPEPSWADVGYLSAIPLAVAALVAHPATHGTATRSARRVFEGLLVATSLLFLSWTLVLGPLWRSTDLSTLGGIVSIAYPFGDVVIVFFIVLAIRGMSGGDRLPLLCLLGGLMAMAISDSTFTYLTDTSSYTSPGLVDTGWVVAYLGIALSAFSARKGGVGVRVATVERARPSLASLVAPIAPVLIALAVAAVEIRLGDHIGRPAWLMVFALVVLVLTRQGFAVVELLDHGRDGGKGLMTRITDAALGDGAGGPHAGPGSVY